jgi:hypothetical protein
VNVSTPLVILSEAKDLVRRTIKGWKRFKKVALIDSQNPEWKDLAAEWSKDPSLRSG